MSLKVACLLALHLTAATLTRADDSPITPAQARAAMAVKEIIGHRGSAADRPENTLASFRRAIEANADVAEVDVRTTKDGFLVCSHDADVSHATDGKGLIAQMTLTEIQKLDAGRKFDAKYAGERMPTFADVLGVCKGKIAVLVDLKEFGEEYANAVADAIRTHGDPKTVVLGVRSLEHVKQFKKLLPEARQIGLVPAVSDIEAFAKEGVRMVRIWPKWLSDADLVPRLRKLGLQIHIGAGLGTRKEVLPLLAHAPESLSSDDPAQLRQTLTEIAKSQP